MTQLFSEDQEKKSTPYIIDNINRVSDLLKFSEAKCLSVVALNAALCVFYFNIKNTIQPNSLSSYGFYIFYAIFLLSIGATFLSSLVSIVAVKPNFVDHAEAKTNFLFYKVIKDRTYLEIKRCFIDYANHNHSGYNEDLCKIMVAYSKVASRKNILFSRSVNLSIFSVFMFSLFCVFCLFYH